MTAMRTRITRTAWFGPRRFGWGLSPASWQGWIALAVWTAALVAGLTLWPGVTTTIVCLAGLTILILLTSDPPGGSFGRSSR